MKRVGGKMKRFFSVLMALFIACSLLVPIVPANAASGTWPRPQYLNEPVYVLGNPISQKAVTYASPHTDYLNDDVYMNCLPIKAVLEKAGIKTAEDRNGKLSFTKDGHAYVMLPNSNVFMVDGVQKTMNYLPRYRMIDIGKYEATYESSPTVYYNKTLYVPEAFFDDYLHLKVLRRRYTENGQMKEKISVEIRKSPEKFKGYAKAPHTLEEVHPRLIEDYIDAQECFGRTYRFMPMLKLNPVEGAATDDPYKDYAAMKKIFNFGEYADGLGYNPVVAAAYPGFIPTVEYEMPRNSTAFAFYTNKEGSKNNYSARMRILGATVEQQFGFYTDDLEKGFNPAAEINYVDYNLPQLTEAVLKYYFPNSWSDILEWFTSGREHADPNVHTPKNRPEDKVYYAPKDRRALYVTTYWNEIYVYISKPGTNANYTPYAQ